MKSRIAVILLAAACFAETWRVPDEAPTIQAALDSTADRDTISITIGDFAEALIAPPHFVYLIGDTAIVEDSLLRPVIDPASLDSSTELSCLRLPAGSAVSAQWLVFRNGAQMFPRNRPGGIAYATYDSIIVRDCLFDSVYHGLFPYDFQARPHFIIERCEFVDMRWSCGNLRGPAHVRNCYVHGNGVSGFGVFDSSIVEDCRFTGTVQNGWLESYRHDTMIRNNVFGPGTHSTPALNVTSRGGADSVLNNTFNCTGIAWKIEAAAGEGPPIVISGNFITDTSANPNKVTITIADYDVATDELHALLSGNTITGGNNTPLGTKGINLTSEIIGVEVSRNRFIDIAGGGPVINTDSNVYHHVIRENFFYGNDYAIHNRSSYDLDARFNWWGDSSGPYHAILNPDALGDSVNSDHPINFFPWLTDTSIWSGVTSERIDLPKDFQLSAFPNPTNATVSINLRTPRQTEVKLKLFDILGREVKTLWSGNVEGFKSLNFDLADEATGMYFVRALSRDDALQASQKIVLLK